jgi:hypothetical protein
MNGESTGFEARRRRREPEATRHEEAQGLYAAAAMLMAEGREKGFHFFALHLCVALRELEDQVGRPMDAATSSGALVPRKPASAAMRRLIRGEGTG